MKICSKCKAEKPLTDFSKNSSASDGIRSRCRSCVADYRSASKARIDEYNDDYRAKNMLRINEQRAKYRAESKEKRANYYELNKARIRKQASEYYEQNKEKYNARDRGRRARVKNAEGNHTSDDVISIFVAQRGLCANCKTKLFKSGKQKYHVDHIMPLALGGSNWPSNLQCLCPPCNHSKAAKSPEAWAKQQGKLL